MPRSSLTFASMGSHGAHAATSAPGWAIAVGIGGAALFLVGWFWLVVLARRPPGFDADEDNGSGPGGGPGWRRPGGPRRPGGEADWWPEFERQFAAHVESARRSPAGRRPRQRVAGSEPQRARGGAATGRAKPGSRALVVVSGDPRP